MPALAEDVRPQVRTTLQHNRRRLPHRPELDAVRFFAFSCVLFDHLPLSSASRFSIVRDIGSFGLSLFFLLSAYLIVALLLKEKEVDHTVDVKAFMMRRVLRIWPLYFLAIALNSVIAVFWLPARVTPYATLSMLLLATNVYIVKRGWLLGLVTPLWSICLEEQFYLAVPWVVRAANRKVIGAFFGFVLVLAYLTLWILGELHAGSLTRIWPNNFVEFQFFAAGALIAVFELQVRRSLIVRGILFLAGLALWWQAQTHYHVHSWVQSESGLRTCAGYGLLLLGTSLVFLAALGTDLQFPKPILYLGTISYGLYVFHQFWIAAFFDGLRLGGQHNQLAAALTVIFTIITATLSYRYFERPVLRLKRRFE